MDPFEIILIKILLNLKNKLSCLYTLIFSLYTEENSRLYIQITILPVTGVILRWANPRPCPPLKKYGMKQCLTNSKHHHISAKRSVCNLQTMPKRVLRSLWELKTLFRTTQSANQGIPSLYTTPIALFGASIFRCLVGKCSYFFPNAALDRIL